MRIENSTTAMLNSWLDITTIQVVQKLKCSLLPVPVGMANTLKFNTFFSISTQTNKQTNCIMRNWSLCELIRVQFIRYGQHEHAQEDLPYIGQLAHTKCKSSCLNMDS